MHACSSYYQDIKISLTILCQFTFKTMCKTASLVTKFAVEDLPLGRTAALVPEFAVEDLPFGRSLMITINTGSS